MSKSPADLLAPGRALALANVADGAQGLVVADLARAVAARPAAPATSVLVICRDGPRMAALSRALAFFDPEVAVQEFPAWDCLPYDRSSPHAGVVAQRMTALSRLARLAGRAVPSVLITTVNAALQRVPARELVADQSLAVVPGQVLDMQGIVRWLELHGATPADRAELLQLLADLGEHKEALGRAKELIKKQPKLDYYRILAHSAIDERRCDSVTGELEEATRRLPDQSEIWSLYGLCAKQIGLHEQAVHALYEAERLHKGKKLR